MAIGTGDGVEKFGTQAAITNAAISINDGAFSLQSDAVAWTNSDDAPDADILIEASFAVSPNENTVISAYARKLNVRGLNDENIPTLNNENIYLGVLPLDAANVSQIGTIRIELRNGKASQEYEFYFKNSGGQNITSMQAWITPIAIGPAT